MDFVKTEMYDNTAVVTMQHGKVNAINREFVDELAECFERLEKDDNTRAVVLTGNEKFFSFGFDLPELLTYDRDELKNFLTGFAQLKTRMFIFPKPLIAAIGGHATAGGCMLALTADYRIMAEGRGKMALNEINLGVPVFACTVAMLRALVGFKSAEKILTRGDMYSVDQAHELGLVDTVVLPEEVMTKSLQVAQELGVKPSVAFRLIKQLLRQEIVDSVREIEPGVIEQFVEAWFSEETQKILKTVEIR